MRKHFDQLFKQAAPEDKQGEEGVVHDETDETEVPVSGAGLAAEMDNGIVPMLHVVPKPQGGSTPTTKPEPQLRRSTRVSVPVMKLNL